MSVYDKVFESAQKHPKPSRSFAYGTAGFRTKAADLDSVMYATGLLASLRSRFLSGRTVGVMITASHNPPPDNGVKIVDPSGDMLEVAWESYATLLANAGPKELVEHVKKLVDELHIELGDSASVVIARDSRASGPALRDAVIDGLSALSTHVTDMGTLTTPQLHVVTRAHNTAGDVSEDGYFRTLIDAFNGVMSVAGNGVKHSVVIDAANGIGAPKAVLLLQQLSEHFSSYKVVNDNWKHPDTLNSSCGADFVKTGQKLPAGVTTETKGPMCSYDGDADRVVFYYNDDAGKFHLLDGDKISTLFAKHFVSLVLQTGLDLQVGVVQTAYANGSSTMYLEKKLGVPVRCTPTGVKHLHHVAKEFDIGIYFEANGHGTVLFSDKVASSISSAKPDSEFQKKALQELSYFSKLINQTVGDAISDMLAVLAVLASAKLTPDTWDKEYTDLPNKLAKVVVKDRTVFKTTDAERKLVSPEGLQAKIDAIVATVKQGRSFVRASGTEDAVRVYAEGETPEEVDRLSKEVCSLL